MNKYIEDIIRVLEENGWSANSVDLKTISVKASKNFMEIQITTERCSCHGGRLWVNSSHTNNHFELSHESYDESLGIVDPDTELSYIINNELVDVLKKISTFVYKLTVINEFGKKNGVDEEKIDYFSNMESITQRILDYKNKDIVDYNTIDEVTVKYPNENIIRKVKRITVEPKYSWENNRVWFSCERLVRKDKSLPFEVEKEYKMYVSLFKK